MAFGIGSVIKLLPLAATGFTALGTAVTFATGPVGVAIIALGALAAIIAAAAGANDRARDSFTSLSNANNTLSSTVNPLLSRYDELASKSKRTTEEQTELAAIIKKVEATIPGAVTKVDDYGTAIEISTSKTRLLIEAQRELERASARENLAPATDELKRYQAELTTLRTKIDEFNRTGNITVTLGGAAGGVTQKVALTSAELAKLQREVAETNVKFLEQEQYVRRLNDTLGNTPRTFQQIIQDSKALETALTNPFLNGIEAANKFNQLKAGGQVTIPVTPVIEPQTLQKLKDQLKAAQEQLQVTDTNSKDFAATKAKIASLQALISKLEETSKASQKSASEIQRAFDSISNKLQGVDTQSKLGIIGSSAEATAAKVKVLEDGLKKLSDLGVSPANNKLQALNTQLLGLQQTLNQGFAPIAIKVSNIEVERTLGDKLGKDIAAIINPALANQSLTLPEFLPQGNDKGQALLNTTIALNSELAKSNALSVAFGSSFGETAANMGSLNTAITTLLAAGFDAKSLEVQGLVAAFNQLGLTKAPLEEFNAGLTNVINGSLANLASGIGEAIGQIVTGAAGIEALPKVVLGALGNLAIQVGELAIGTGIAILGIKKALESLNPIAAIAGGIALVALGSIVKGAASRIGSGKGSGGGFSPTTSSAASPTSPAASKSNKLEIEVTFAPAVTRVRGADLETVLNVEKYRLKRVGG